MRQFFIVFRVRGLRFRNMHAVSLNAALAELRAEFPAFQVVSTREVPVTEVITEVR